MRDKFDEESINPDNLVVDDYVDREEEDED